MTLRQSNFRAFRILGALFVLVVALLPLTPSTAAPAATGQQVTQMIVKYKPGQAMVNAQGNARGEEELDAADRGLKLGKDLGFGYRVVTLPRATDEVKAHDEARRLRLSPAVAWAEPDLPVSINGAGSQPTPPSWGLDRLDQAALPLNTKYDYDTSGAGVTAYVVDTGILDTHLEFGGRVRAGISTVGGTTVDCNGHGTHVAGTIGGARYGVAKDVSLVAVRVLDCLGSGTNSGVISGINWAITDHVAGPAVLNMSLGGGFSQALNDAVLAAVNDGITVVVASGNSNADACTSSPASAPSAITVNAMDSAGARATFSNFGSCTDIYAPGVNITSAWSTGNTAINTISGTSMASPHVAGAAARILESTPNATPAQVWTALSAAASAFSSGIALDPTKLLYLNAGTIAAAAPSAPVWVTGTAAAAAATLSWGAPVSSPGSAVSGYTVNAYNASAAGSLVGSCTPSPATATTCTVTGLTNGLTYWLDVTATNGTGSGTTSNRVAVVPVAPATAPGSPTAVTAAAGASGQAVVRWTVPASNGGSAITSFSARAYTALTGGTAARTCTATGATAVTCTITGLTNGTTYYVDVIATNAVGASAPSAPRVSVVPVGVPGAPTAVRATAGVASAVISWTAPASNGGSAILSYTATAWSATTGGTARGTCTIAAPTLTCTIPGLAARTTVYVSVTATNAIGTGAASTRVSVRPN